MKTVHSLLLSAVLALSVSSQAAASEDLRREYCERFLERLGTSVGDFNSGDEISNWSDEDIVRYSYLSYQERDLRLKTRYCLYVVFHDDDDHSPHEDNDGEDWEEAWSKYD